MADSTFMPIEVAFTRTVGLAAEIVDGVTLRPIRSGIAVTATGLTRPPVVNASGLWVWFAEQGSTPQAITVTSPDGVYEDASALPLAPPDRRRIELAPTPRYRFAAGATALRGTLLERAGSAIFGTASSKPVVDAQVRLQWSSDAGWNDAPLASRTDAKGDFAAALRLPADAEALTDAKGALSVRLRVTRAGATRVSSALALRAGAVAPIGQPLMWKELLPYP